MFFSLLCQGVFTFDNYFFKADYSFLLLVSFESIPIAAALAIIRRAVITISHNTFWVECFKLP